VDLLCSLLLGLLLGLLGKLSLVHEVGVQSHSSTEVLEVVLSSGQSSHSKDGRLHLRLNFVRVDQSSQVRVGHRRSGESVTRLLSRGEKRLESLKGILSPDNESAQVSTRGHLEQGQVVHVHRFHTRDVSHSQVNTLSFVVHNNRTSSSSPSSVSPLTLTSSQGLRFLASFQFLVQTQSCEQSHGLLGLLDSGSLVRNNKRNFLDILDSVTSGSHHRGDGRSSDGRTQSKSLLVHIDLSVPLSPGLGGLEHSASSTHVAEGTLARSLSSSSSYSGNSRNGSACAPGFSRSLLAGLSGDGIRLSSVLGHVGVHKVHHIGSDGCLEDIGDRNLSDLGFAIQAPNRDKLTGSGGSRHDE
jgi:hypothetical protein